MNGARKSETEILDDGELPPFSTALRRLVSPRELAVLAVFPAVIAGTFLLPLEARRALAFAYTDPTVLTAYVSHFVHFRVDHLLANLIGYLLVVPATYLLSAFADRRRLFWIMFATVLLAGPFVLSGLNLAVPRSAIGYGSSGLIMAFFGILPVALYNYVRPLFVSELRTRDLPVLFFLVVGIISGIVLPRSDATLAIAVVSGILAVVYGGFILVRERRARNRFGTPTRPVRPFGYVELPLVGGLLVVGYPLVGFPSELVAANRVVNLYVHFLGFAIVFLATYLGEVTHVLAETTGTDAK